MILSQRFSIDRPNLVLSMPFNWLFIAFGQILYRLPIDQEKLLADCFG